MVFGRFSITISIVNDLNSCSSRLNAPTIMLAYWQPCSTSQKTAFQTCSKARAIQLNNSWTAFPNWYGKKRSVSPDPTLRTRALGNKFARSLGWSGLQRRLPGHYHRKDGPRKKHDKTESSNNWRGYSPPVPEKKETKAEKKIDKEASCPDVTVLQEVKNHGTTLCLVSFIIFAENRSRNSTKHRARYLFCFCFEINNLRTFSKRRGLSLGKL